MANVFGAVVSGGRGSAFDNGYGHYTIASQIERNEATTLQVTPCFVELVRVVAAQRTASHDGRRTASQDLGPEQNARADFFGLLGEAALIDALERAGFHPAGYTLFAESYPTGRDFLLNGHRYDIKSVRPGSGWANVNEDKLLEMERVHAAVLPVVFLSMREAQVMQPVPIVAFLTQPLRRAHSEFRGLAINRLLPLRSFADLLQGGQAR